MEDGQAGEGTGKQQAARVCTDLLHENVRPLARMWWACAASAI